LITFFFSVHETEDPILETLRHIPELAKMRQKKHEVEERKVKAFRKLTHLVLRKQTEQLEKNTLYVRRDNLRLKDELQDDKNLHRHLHLHHGQNHGLNETDTSAISTLEASLLKASNSNDGVAEKDSQSLFIIIGLSVVAVILVVVIIFFTTKAHNAKTTKKDYY